MKKNYKFLKQFYLHFDSDLKDFYFGDMDFNYQIRKNGSFFVIGEEKCEAILVLEGFVYLQ